MGSYGLLGSKAVVNGAPNYSYTDYSIALTKEKYTYRIDALDNCGNVSSAYTSMVETPNRTAPVPVITCDAIMEVGVQYEIDASKSTSTAAIVKYEFDLGDGTTSTDRRVIHRYTQIGTYTISLTVTDEDGNHTTTQKVIQVRDRTLLGTARIRIVDENGKAVPNAPVYFDLGEPNQVVRATDASGYVSFTTEVGKHMIGCIIADNEWLPVKKEIIVTAGETTNVTMTMINHKMIEGIFEIHRMTFDEIIAAGIDVSKPENQYIVNITVRLTYGTQTVDASFKYNGITGATINSRPIIVDTPTGKRQIVPVPIALKNPGSDYVLERDVAIAYLDIPIGVSTLKEFFDVKLHIINNASSEFRMLNNVVTLNVPDGLTLMDTLVSEKNRTVTIPEITGQSTKTINWILRGDKKGEYYLSADYAGLLDLFNETVTTKFIAEDPIIVSGIEDSIEVILETPEYIFNNPPEECNIAVEFVKGENGKDTKEVANYKYTKTAYFNIGMKNISDRVLYMPQIFVDGNNAVFTDVDELVYNLTPSFEAAYLVSGEVRRKLNAGEEIIGLKPGEMLLYYYKVENHNVDNNFYYQLRDQKIVESSNYDVNLVFDVRNDVFYEHYFDHADSDAVTITYRSSSNTDRTTEFKYRDDFFSGNSYDYNYDLALMSLGMVMAGYSDIAYEDAYTMNLSGTNYARATNVLKAYAQLGFDKAVCYDYNVSLGSPAHKVAFSIAQKYIANEAGDKDTVLAVVLRGGGYGAEWASNFVIGNSGDHQGFDTASDKVLNTLKAYIADLSNRGLIKGDLKLWITGYSRAAAVANLTTQKINKQASLGGVALKQKNIFAYTFATPMGVNKVAHGSIGTDNNIFNIVSPLDFVPHVAPESWAYGRFGTTLFLPTTATKSDISSKFVELTGLNADLFNITSLQGTSIDAVMVLLSGMFPDSTKYYNTIQDVVYLLLSNVFSGQEVDWMALVPEAISTCFTVDNFGDFVDTVELTKDILTILSLVIAYFAYDIYEQLEDVADLFASGNVFAFLAKKIVDKVIDYVVDMIKEYVIEKGFMGIPTAHYPEYYLSCLRDGNYTSTAAFDNMARYKQLTAWCPVDLNVYDSQNRLVAQISNNVVTVDKIPTYVVDDTKYVYLDGDDYRIEWIGNDSGEMDYSIAEYDGNTDWVRTINFYGLPLEAGTAYTQTISQDILNGAEDYSLDCGGNSVSSDFDSLLSTSPDFNVTVINGSALQETAKTGEKIKLMAEIREDDEFVTWIAEPEAEFSDPTSMFSDVIMPYGDVIITAVYESDGVDDLMAAKELVENAQYTAEQADIASEADALAKINEILNGLSLNGVTATVEKVSYMPAIAGTESVPAGFDGSYVFTVTLSKSGIATQLTTDELVLSIAATEAIVKTGLRAKIDEVKDTVKGNYTDESWNAFQIALTTAQAVAANANATQAQVDSALTALSSTFSDLTLKPVDKAMLNARISEVKDTQKGDYTNESWGDFQSALIAAQALASNANATQAQVDSALLALNSAFSSLTVKPVNKLALNTRINEVKDTQKGYYTDESWSAFQSALTAAQAVADNANATQAQIDGALATLNSTFSSLALKPVDKAALNARINEVKDTQKGNYTDDSWSFFQSALSVAQTVVVNSGTTQAQVDNALATLNNAFANLKVKSAIQKPIANGPTSTTLEYKASQTLSVNGEGVTWSGGNKYVSVDPQTGRITSLKNFIKTGSATITATNSAGSVSFNVKVAPSFLQWLMIIFLFGWIWM